MEIQKLKFRVQNNIPRIRKCLLFLGLNYPSKNNNSFYSDYRDQFDWIFKDAQIAYLKKIKEIHPDNINNLNKKNSHNETVYLNALWGKIKRYFSKYGVDTGVNKQLICLIKKKKYIYKENPKTYPYKLKEKEMEVLNYFKTGNTMKDMVTHFNVNRNSIKNCLNKQGIYTDRQKKLRKILDLEKQKV